MSLDKKQEVEVRATIASLYYLAKEAEAAGLVEMSNIILASINDIDKWLNKNNKEAFEMIVENDLFHLLEFMHKFTNKEKIKIICEILMIRKENDLEEAKLLN